MNNILLLILQPRIIYMDNIETWHRKGIWKSRILSIMFLITGGCFYCLGDHSVQHTHHLASSLLNSSNLPAFIFHHILHVPHFLFICTHRFLYLKYVYGRKLSRWHPPFLAEEQLLFLIERLYWSMFPFMFTNCKTETCSSASFLMVEVPVSKICFPQEWMMLTVPSCLYPQVC